jgi:hypothetical protein
MTSRSTARSQANRITHTPDSLTPGLIWGNTLSDAAAGDNASV